MTRPMRLLVALVLAVPMLAAPVGAALACSCMPLTTLQAFELADAVFVGTPVAVEEPPAFGAISSLDPVAYQFTVEAVYKGPVRSAELAVVTARDGASCGMSFALRERWLVFATISEQQLHTGLCLGNVQVPLGDIDPNPLDELPAPVSLPPAENTAVEPPYGLFAGVAVMLVLIGLSGWAFTRGPGRPEA